MFTRKPQINAECLSPVYDFNAECYSYLLIKSRIGKRVVVSIGFTSNRVPAMVVIMQKQK